MDLNKLNKFVDSASKVSSISKARSSFINEVKNLKEGYQSQLLEAREPITKLEEKRIQSQKKSDDERQDKLITQLQDNQRAITSELRNIKYDEKALVDELPFALEAPEEEAKKTKIKHPMINIDKIFNEEDKEILKSFGLDAPRDLFLFREKQLIDLKSRAKNINQSVIGQRKSQLTKKMGEKAKNDDEYKKLERKKQTLDKYKTFVEDNLRYNAYKTKGQGIRKYKQPKRNAYKIQNSSNRSPSVWHYGGLLVDYPKLMNNMLLEVYKNNQLVYQDKADKSLIDLLTKRYNPKTKYSIDAVRIFNDLNLLTNMAKHKSSKKSNMIGSSLWLLPPAHSAGGSSLVDRSDPNKLAKRLEIIVGSLNAGNNSRILKNDLTLINNELYRIGAITKEMHDALVKKFINP